VTDATFPAALTDGVAVVATPAEIDINNAGQLRAALLAATETGHVVVADMTATCYCDSSGIHALVAAHRSARAKGRDLRLVIAPGGVVQRVIALTAIDTVISCFSSLEDALAQEPDSATAV
jgi:anti-sigma B factor antagonist